MIKITLYLISRRLINYHGRNEIHILNMSFKKRNFLMLNVLFKKTIPIFPVNFSLKMKLLKRKEKKKNLLQNDQNWKKPPSWKFII